MGCFPYRISSPRLQIASTLQLTHTWVLPYYTTCAQLFKYYYKYPELGFIQPKTKYSFSVTYPSFHFHIDGKKFEQNSKGYLVDCTVIPQITSFSP